MSDNPVGNSSIFIAQCQKYYKSVAFLKINDRLSFAYVKISWEFVGKLSTSNKLSFGGVQIS